MAVRNQTRSDIVTPFVQSNIHRSLKVMGIPKQIVRQCIAYSSVNAHYGIKRIIDDLDAYLELNTYSEMSLEGVYLTRSLMPILLECEVTGDRIDGTCIHPRVKTFVHSFTSNFVDN